MSLRQFGIHAFFSSFADRWKGGIQNYVSWMEDKLRECFRVLKPPGSMYLHCDWHAAHYLKAEMDKIFGDRLINHIVWKRTSAHTGEGKIRSYGTVHDAILFYTKGDNYVFNPQYVPLNTEYVEKFYRYTDPDGRRWTASDLMAAGYVPSCLAEKVRYDLISVDFQDPGFVSIIEVDIELVDPSVNKFL